MSVNPQIVSLLKARNQAGLSLLYKNYSEVLYGMSYRILNNQAFAEDALQQSFLKIWNGIETFDDSKSTLFTWMARIVRNTSIDISRLKSFQKENKTESIDTNVHNTETVTINTDQVDVKNLLDGMDAKYREVLDYLYLRGYSQSEMSDELGMPLGTIKTRAKKAIDILRDKLKNEKTLFFGSVLILIIIIKFLLT